MKVDLFDVVVFAAVVRGNGFAAAARELELPPSAVSRRVKRLEEQLGVKLLHRTTRKVGLTAAGRVYYERIAPIPLQIEDAERALIETRERPAGSVRVAAPPDAGGVIWGALSGYLRDHPEVDLELFHALAYEDLIEREIDVAMRGGEPPDTSEFTAQLLWDSRILLAASPGYLARRGTPTTVDDLSDHDGICMDGWAPNAIRRIGGEAGPVRLTIHNRIRANSLDTAHLAALDGFGIAPLLQLTCQADLDRGALVEVLRGCLPDSAKMWLIYPVGRKRSAAAQALIDRLLQTSDDPRHQR